MLLRFYFKRNKFITLFCTQDEYCDALCFVKNECDVGIPLRAIFIEKFGTVKKAAFCSAFSEYVIIKDWMVSSTKLQVFLTKRVHKIKHVG